MNYYQLNTKTMKRKSILIAMLFLMLMACDLKAQNIVSTNSQSRNVLIEEFTGINCPNCPDGHKVANSITDYYPDKVWAVNIHAGHYAPTYYPNFNTEDGTAIYGGFNITGFPQAVINRTTENGVSRTDWSSHTTLQMEQTAECNVGGQVIIDHQARTATITVEVYYTANSAENTNYLNVIMLQNNILAYQSGMSANPDQVVNGQYRHMHIFRDAITPAWGDAISPTTAGTLVTKTYTYNIPQTIGNNGVDVVIDDIEFLAFVTEKYQGTPTRPILNVNELHVFTTTNQDIYPSIVSLETSSKFSCSNDRVINVAVINSGLDDITSLEFEVSVDNGQPSVQSWQGNIPPYQTVNVEVEAEVPEGTHNVDVKIIKANNADFSDNASMSITNEGWSIAEINGEEETFTIELMQDKYGNQITWELLASDYSVLASGGPYDIISGSSATALHETEVTIPAGECVKFIIKDSKENGICCQFGEGYYRILDSKGNVIVDGDGDFGGEASEVMSVVGIESQIEVPTNVVASPTSTNSIALTWDSVEGAISYGVHYNNELIATVEETNINITDLETNTEYCYTVTASDESVESEHSEQACATTWGEGVEELSTFVAIYPNPVNDNLFIATEDNIEEITIYTLTGVVIYNETNSNNTVDVSKLSDGIYFIKVKTSKGEMMRRFTKN